MEDCGHSKRDAGVSAGAAGAWAVLIAPGAERAAASLRLRRGILACQNESGLWLRGEELSEELDRALRRVAPQQRYRILGDGQLVRWDRRVPCGYLPKGSWVPLAQWIGARWPTACLPGETDRRAGIDLVRCQTLREPAVLRTELAAWAEYAGSAAAVRLRRLRFAADAAGQAILWGTRLPPLPGTRYVEVGQIAVPCGWTWRPAVDAEVLRELLGLEMGDLALFETEGSYQRIAAGDFVQAGRSAARLTVQGLAEGLKETAREQG